MTKAAQDLAALFASLSQQTGAMAATAARVEAEIALLLRPPAAPGADLQQIDLLRQQLGAMSGLFHTLHHQISAGPTRLDIAAALTALALPSLAQALTNPLPPPQSGHLDLF